MSIELVLVFVAGTLVVIALYHGVLANEDKKQVRQYLRRKGATNIVVSWQWYGGDRANHVYDVRYLTRAKQQRFTQCKIRSAWWSGGEIYWSEPPEV
jgi:hypothetical protein